MYVFIGLIRVDFTAPETGEKIQGWNLWLGEPAESPSAGYRPVKKFLRDEQMGSIFAPMGGPSVVANYALHEVDVLTGLRGQVMGIEFRK